MQYRGQSLQSRLRLDFLIEGKIIIELKSVEKILPVHEAQIITYLKLSQAPVGFLANFNVPLIKNGVKRYVNDLKEETSAASATPR